MNTSRTKRDLKSSGFEGNQVVRSDSGKFSYDPKTKTTKPRTENNNSCIVLTGKYRQKSKNVKLIFNKYSYVTVVVKDSVKFLVEET